ncbi:MAG TPA: hypothetical protein VGR08_11075 [Thermomicrobiales bacterium]|nr:hypothetical protein [Thermomicrobiales bacterium]
MSGTGVVVLAAIIVILLVALYMSIKPGFARREVRRRSSQGTGVYPGGVYPIAADTGARDGRGHGRNSDNPSDATPDAGSDGGSGSGSSSGGWFGVATAEAEVTQVMEGEAATANRGGISA